jgi:hypothetical protein
MASSKSDFAQNNRLFGSHSKVYESLMPVQHRRHNYPNALISAFLDSASGGLVLHSMPEIDIEHDATSSSKDLKYWTVRNLRNEVNGSLSHS